MSDIAWITVTTLGSKFEEEMSKCGRYWRHRPMNAGALAALMGSDDGGEPYVDLPWRRGPAPMPETTKKPRHP